MKKSMMFLSALFLLGAGLYTGWKVHEDSLHFAKPFGGSTARITQEDTTNVGVPTEPLTDTTNTTTALEEVRDDASDSAIEIIDATETSDNEVLEDVSENASEDSVSNDETAEAEEGTTNSDN